MATSILDPRFRYTPSVSTDRPQDHSTRIQTAGRTEGRAARRQGRHDQAGREVTGGYPDGMSPHDLPGDDLDAECREAAFEEEVDGEALMDLITRSAIPGALNKAYVAHCFALPAGADDSRTAWANGLRRTNDALWVLSCERMRTKLSQRSTNEE